MVKSVFISSTSMDLEAHRDVVRDAILSLDMRPIDMKYFGSRPGNALDVSLDQVHQADIFIGIIAHRYGYIPDGQSKSITELEYEAAVNAKIPRLMYIIDPTYQWNPAYIETDPQSQANLRQFKQGIERNHVRRLFTTPTSLAQQVPIDLARLQMAQSDIARKSQSQRLRRLMMLGVLGFILMLGVIALIVLSGNSDDDGNQAENTPITSTTITLTNTPTIGVVCGDALPPQFQVGDLGIILDDDTRSLNVRSDAGTGFDRIDQLAIGQLFTVLDGPVCNDGFNWYQIAYGDINAQGWIAEGTSDVYFIAPFIEETVEPTEIIAQDINTDCPVILVDEAFDGDSELIWFEGGGASSNVVINNSAYEITLNEPPAEDYTTSWGSLQTLRFGDASTRATLRAQHFEPEDRTRTGLWLRYQDDRNFIAFMLRSDGTYIVSRFQDTYTNLSENWVFSSAINIGDNVVNNLRVDSVGNRFDLYINDVLVDNFEDDTWADGRVAFMGASPFVPATFFMDDIQICGG